MNIGDLKKRIQIQSPVYSQTANGSFTTDWTLDRIVWCAIRPKEGGEVERSAQKQGTVKHEVEIRKQPDLAVSATKRLVFKDRVLNIESVLNENENDFTQMISCVETVENPEFKGLYTSEGVLITTTQGQTIFI